MNWLNSYRRRNGIPKTNLRVEAMEDRTVPTIVITGTPGNDTVTSKFVTLQSPEVVAWGRGGSWPVVT